MSEGKGLALPLWINISARAFYILWNGQIHFLRTNFKTWIQPQILTGPYVIICL